jgi:outer membrane beta-barrel protein
MTRLASSLLVASLLAFAPAMARGARQADALAGRIPPISGQLYNKAGRLELTPTLNLSMNDAFFSKVLFGAKVGWHFTDHFSIHGAFATGMNSETGSTSVCTSTGCRPAESPQLYQVPGNLRSVGGVELGFSPIYGKLNVFAEKVIHFDLSLLGGADWISHRDVLPASLANAGETPGNRSTFGAHVGVGARIFMGRALALRMEVKDYLYRVPILGETTLQNQLFTEIGLSVFLPSAGRRDRP